jgi:hypothetical protein
MTYLIEAPHSADECAQAMDEALAKGPRFLAQFDWGCVEGEHTGWARVEAEDVSDARSMVPTVARSRARVVRVGKASPDLVNAMLSLPSETEGPTDMPDPYEVLLAGQDEEAEEAEETQETEEDPWGPEAWVTP